MKILARVFVPAALAAVSFAGPFLDENTTLINGFAEKVMGQDFVYHSSIPLARESLLIRATDGNSVMEWKTAPAPDRIPAEFVTFAWLAGIGSSPGRAAFDLAVDGVHAFTFWTDGGENWELVSEDGASLRFRQNGIDQHGDRFGFMFLTIPAARLKAGTPLSIKATGGNFGKSSWYMTFTFPLESGLSFRALPALVEGPEQTHQVGIAGILHFGGPDTARISIGENPAKEIAVNFGYTHARLQWPAVDEKTRLPYRLDLAGQTWQGELEVRPVRRWRVNFVQHTHTDIGYTRPQTEILAEHLRFIDTALDYCDLTDDLPDEAKFRWTCEASWAVDAYLRSRPAAQVERLLARVGEGRIEITGMFFNFDELPDEQTLAASLRPLRRFRDLGLEVKTAMQNDVNGIAWCLNDAFHDLGVKYLNMGTHGHRALICFDKPTLFWWESPSGKRMLAYRAEHYMTGNTVFKIHAGDFQVFEEELLVYLSGLEKKGYEYDVISIQHSGYLTDNAPPSTFASDMIRRWNNTYSWPKLKTASATEFFEDMEARHGESFPVIRGAWPDWWTDGFGASAREAAVTRIAQSDLIAHTAGLTMAALQGAALPEKFADRVEAANEALLFYTEHTVGYHGSVRRPFHKNTMEQRALKESYAWEASRRAKMLGEEALGLLQSYHAREKEPSLVVFNTLNWRRSGLVNVYIDHQLLPRDVPFAIVDQTGKPVKAQPLERHSDGTYWAVRADDIPAFGFKKYVIKTGVDAPAQGPSRRPPDGHILENRWYRIVVDPDRGAISGITDKELNLNIVDAKSAWKFGEFIYERLDNRAQMEAFKLDNYTREPLDRVRFDAWEPGDVWDTLRFKGDTRAAERDDAYVFEIRLFHDEKRIDLAYAIEKKMVVDPEGIYVALPFFLKNGVLAFDVPGGEIRAGVDQIPGSANDWNTVQNYARLYNDEAQILIGSREIPLMQFGGINTGRYQAGAVPETTHIYGWPMNNYWVTNFNPEQHGGIEWTYTISSRAGRQGFEAVRFGWGNRTPFLGRVFAGGGSGDEIWEGSFITGWPDHVLLVSAAPDPDGRSAVFQIRETGGKKVAVRLQNGLTGSPLVCTHVDALGRPVENGSLELHPFESKFIRVDF